MSEGERDRCGERHVGRAEGVAKFIKGTGTASGEKLERLVGPSCGEASEAT